MPSGLTGSFRYRQAFNEKKWRTSTEGDTNEALSSPTAAHSRNSQGSPETPLAASPQRGGTDGKPEFEEWVNAASPQQGEGRVPNTHAGEDDGPANLDRSMSGVSTKGASSHSGGKELFLITKMHDGGSSAQLEGAVRAETPSHGDGSASFDGIVKSTSGIDGNVVSVCVCVCVNGFMGVS